MTIRSILAGVGAYLPERAVSNDELALRLETSDAWIRDRTGIRQRYIAGPHETCAFMATQAARAALRQAEAEAAEVDAVILATSTPDQSLSGHRAARPGGVGYSGRLRVRPRRSLRRLHLCPFGCRRNDPCRPNAGVLVIGSEVYSRILNWQDRGTCVLFGDGAGAVFLRAGDGRDR